MMGPWLSDFRSADDRIRSISFRFSSSLLKSNESSNRGRISALALFGGDSGSRSGGENGGELGGGSVDDEGRGEGEPTGTSPMIGRLSMKSRGDGEPP